LAPPELPGLLATMGALTPGRPALRLPREHEHRLWRRPGLHASCHRTFRSFRLQPPAVAPTCLWGFLRWAYRTMLPWSPFSRVQASIGLRLYLAGSPRRPAESRSLALRTNRSPPVALHPASRRRSYLWLRSARAPRQGLSPCCFDALAFALGGGSVPRSESPDGAGSYRTVPQGPLFRDFARKSVDSTSVTSPRRARIFWKFAGRSSRLVDVARALFQIAPVTRD